MADFATLELAVGDDGVAHLTFNRPEAANAVSLQLAKDLRDAAVALSGDRRVRAVLVSGNGPMFSGGGDLKEFRAADDLGRHIADTTIELHAAVGRLARLDAPVIAAVHGAAGGAGMSFVAAADLVVAAESAKFTMGYTKAGLVPDGSSTYFLARCVGLKRAMDLVLTNRVLSAAEAEAWGLVNRVVPDAELGPAAQKLAAQLAAGPTQSFGSAKRLVVEGANRSLDEALHAESLAIVAAAATPDGIEGITAFLEKRKPAFGSPADA